MKKKLLSSTYNETSQVRTDVATEYTLNEETGELQEKTDVKRTSYGPRFWRVYRKEYLEYWGRVTTYCEDIFCLLFENVHPGDNICYLTQEQIAKASGYGRTVTRKKLKVLLDADIIRMVKYGQYMINPHIYVYDLSSSNMQRNILIRNYEAAATPKVKNSSIKGIVAERNERRTKHQEEVSTCQEESHRN